MQVAAIGPDTNDVLCHEDRQLDRGGLYRRDDQAHERKRECAHAGKAALAHALKHDGGDCDEVEVPVCYHLVHLRPAVSAILFGLKAGQTHGVAVIIDKMACLC